MQAMKHIIFALSFALLLGGCVSNSGTPWERNTARPAAQAPSSIADRQGQASAQDPRLAYYRGLAGAPQVDGTVLSPPNQQSYDPRFGAMIDGMTAPIPGAPVTSAMPPVKVALLVPLSGPHQELGQAMQNAAQLALFDMGYETFELMPRDTGNSPEMARQAAVSAINDGAQLILGPVFADAVRAVKPIAADRGVSVVAFSTDWTVAGGNTYIMGFLPFGQVQRIAEYAAANNVRRVGILAPDNQYGNAVVTAYQNAVRVMGAPTADVTRFPANQQNINDIVKNFSRYDQRMAQYAPRLKPLEDRLKADPNDTDAQAQMKAIKAEANSALPYDAVLLPVGGERASAIAGLLRFYDMDADNVRLLGTGLWDDTALARDPALRGSWFAAPQPDLRSGFERNYRETYGGMAPPRLATLAYDATALAVVLARNGVQTTGRPQFDHNAITNPNGFAGIDGIFRFRPDGLVERGQAILTYKDMSIQMLDRAPNTFQTAPMLQNVSSRGEM
jgi:ABC-type branched-subunit amino acid transport system substrate-binding protein